MLRLRFCISSFVNLNNHLLLHRLLPQRIIIMDPIIEGEMVLVSLIVLFLTGWAALATTPRHPYITPVEYETIDFDLDEWPPERLRRTMRFTKDEIRQLLTYFDLESIVYRERRNPTPEFAICLLLCKLSHPRPLFELSTRFGRSPSYLSVVLNDVLEHLRNRYTSILQWHPSLTYNRVRRYARAVKRSGNMRGRSVIWGFIDGTFRRLARPEKRQHFWYSAYKKSHGMGWLAITCPDGLIGSFYGPFEGKMNDIVMLQKSGISQRLRDLFYGRRQYDLFGDKAYVHQDFIMCPYRGWTSKRRKRFNTSMSKARVAVEHSFGLTQNLWVSNAFKQQLKSGLQPVGDLYKVSILLTNCYTCLHGNQIGNRFGIRPPTLHQYLSVIEPNS